ncbi:methionyl-tRNA synthetase [Vanrija albida]|uniref:methionine--tRNA ligase n=1 Tax=Vanrija albida TaxID=181172 RepID=A0ABR3Q9F0_9TREE
MRLLGGRGLGGLARAPLPRHTTLSLAARRHNSTSPARPPFFTAPADEAPQPWYITTPIFYVNASPHIGHLHSVVLADTFARFARLREPGREVMFLTGTDEHGLKIQQAAAKAGKSEQEFCDEVSQRFRNLADRANISYTTFFRTTEARHYAAVQAFWEQLVARGDVYKGSHSGWYSVSDECFYSDLQVEKVDGVMVSSETGSEVSWQEEENWKFKLGAYGPQLTEWLSRPESVYPESYRQDLLKQAASLTDLSVSRPSSRVSWGVPVPNDPTQTIYVWVDALLNYLTNTGYPAPTTGWPANMHVVGKDIIKFHAMHWPALLMAAGVAPPKRVLAHAHWTMHRAKMSKSRGNVADPLAAMDQYGVDGVRWYLMRAGGSLPTDADYAPVELSANYDRLRDQVGNLVQRIGSGAILGRVGAWSAAHAAAAPELGSSLGALRDEYDARFEAYDISRAAALLMDTVVDANRFFTDAAPWAAEDSTAAVVYAYSALRLVGILAQPIMPAKAVELLDRLGVPEAERGWADATWGGEVDTAEIVRRIQAGADKFKGTTLFPRAVVEEAAPEQKKGSGKKAKKEKKEKKKENK